MKKIKVIADALLALAVVTFFIQVKFQEQGQSSKPQTLLLILNLIFIVGLFLVLFSVRLQAHKMNEKDMKINSLTGNVLKYINHMAFGKGFRELILAHDFDMVKFLELVSRSSIIHNPDVHRKTVSEKIALILRKEIQTIQEQEKNMPLTAIEKLFIKVSVLEAGDDFGTNQYLLDLQNFVITNCSDEVIRAAETEYRYICKENGVPQAFSLLKELYKKEIFAKMGLADRLVDITTKIEVVEAI